MAGDDETLQAVHHVVGGERRAVVEAHTVAEPEGPDQAVPRGCPLHSQPRLDVAAALPVLHEGVEDLAGDEGQRPVAGGGGIDCEWNHWKPHAQDGALGPCHARSARSER
jgi:hypothetical protein